MIIVATNVLVSGLITSTTSATTARLVNAMVSGHLRPRMSPARLDEYRAVLLRARIVQRHGLTIEQVAYLLSAIIQYVLWREPMPASNPAPDPGDNHLWALLEAEPAATLVTGDLRLLDAPPFEARVVSVTAYEWPVNCSRARPSGFKMCAYLRSAPETALCPLLIKFKWPSSRPFIRVAVR